MSSDNFRTKSLRFERGVSGLKGTWDRGLDPEATRQMLLALMKEAEDRALKGSKRARGRLAKLCVMLIQLENGSRVSEAREAFLAWLKLGRPGHIRKVRVRVRKQKKDPERRLIVIPGPVIEVSQRVGLRPEDVGTKMAICCLAQRLGINTHSLRYAGITRMALSGKMADVAVAKITGHRKIEILLDYIQKVRAEKALEDLVS